MQWTRIIKLKHTYTWFKGIKLTNLIGPLYHSTTKQKNYKANDVFVDSKINNMSQNSRISLVLVERLDLYMKYDIKIESLYWIGSTEISICKFNAMHSNC